MKSSSNTNMNRTASRHSGGGNKKKAIVAAGLLLVMAFMWIKVFSGKKNVQAAKAASQQEQTQEQPEFEISYITMPNISGRNDNLSRDIFDCDQWSGFKVKGGKRVGTGFDIKQDGNGSQMAKTVKRVAEGLRLEAILGGDLPQAFINSKLLSVGQRLVIPYKGQPYEFEVIRISENEVELRCYDLIVTKKIIQP